jgi:hypothetical protein
MCAVVDAGTSNGAPTDVEQGVLANLPRTRPQRATARRAAARNNARAARPDRRSSTTTARREPDGRPQARRAQTRPQPQQRARRRTAAEAPARGSQQKAPPQGFECDESSTSSLHPPGGAELVVSAAGLVGDLAKAGISRGERLVKDLFGRLPLT